MRSLLALVLLLTTVGTAVALEPSEQRGLTFVQTNCSQCHAVGEAGPSPLPIAPPFRTLHERFEIDRLAQPLAEGTISDHPSMPHFSLDAAEIADVLAYLRTLH